eukprot:1221818-Pleurochrysis_carterae.AAC.1
MDNIYRSQLPDWLHANLQPGTREMSHMMRQLSLYKLTCLWYCRRIGHSTCRDTSHLAVTFVCLQPGILRAQKSKEAPVAARSTGQSTLKCPKSVIFVPAQSCKHSKLQPVPILWRYGDSIKIEMCVVWIVRDPSCTDWLQLAQGRVPDIGKSAAAYEDTIRCIDNLLDSRMHF